jgi:hypothetical protein
MVNALICIYLNMCSQITYIDFSKLNIIYTYIKIVRHNNIPMKPRYTARYRYENFFKNF